MDLRLNQSKVTLVRVILPVLLQMPRSTSRFLEQVVKVFRNLCSAFFGENVFKASADNLGD